MGTKTLPYASSTQTPNFWPSSPSCLSVVFLADSFFLGAANRTPIFTINIPSPPNSLMWRIYWSPPHNLTLKDSDRCVGNRYHPSTHAISPTVSVGNPIWHHSISMQIQTRRGVYPCSSFSAQGKSHLFIGLARCHDMFLNIEFTRMRMEMSIGSTTVVTLSDRVFACSIVLSTLQSPNWCVELLQYSINTQRRAGTVGGSGW